MGTHNSGNGISCCAQTYNCGSQTCRSTPFSAASVFAKGLAKIRPAGPLEAAGAGGGGAVDGGGVVGGTGVAGGEGGGGCEGAASVDVEGVAVGVASSAGGW